MERSANEESDEVAPSHKAGRGADTRNHPHKQQEQQQQQQQQQHEEQQQQQHLAAGDATGQSEDAGEAKGPHPLGLLNAGDSFNAPGDALSSFCCPSEQQQEQQGTAAGDTAFASLVPCVRVAPPSGGGSLVVDVAIMGSSLSSTLICAALSRRGFRCLLCEPTTSYGGPHRSMRFRELLEWLEGGACPRGPRGGPQDPDEQELQQTRKKGIAPCPCCCHTDEALGPPGPPCNLHGPPCAGEETEAGCRPPEGGPPKSPPHKCPYGVAPGSPCCCPSASSPPLGLLRLLRCSSSKGRRPFHEGGPPPPSPTDSVEAPTAGPRGVATSRRPPPSLREGGLPGAPREAPPFSRRWFSFGPFLEPAEPPGDNAGLEEGDGDSGGETETDASSTDSTSTDATAETTYTATTSSTADTAQTNRSARYAARPPPLLQPAAAPPSPAAAAAATPGQQQQGTGPFSASSPSMQQPCGDTPALETPQQQHQQQSLGFSVDPLSAAVYQQRHAETPQSETGGDSSSGFQPSPLPCVYTPSEQSLLPLSAVSAAATDVGVAEAVEVAAAEAATAAAAAADAAADAAAADAAAAAGEPPGSVDAQRLQMRHELIADGSLFLIDLMPKYLYTSSDVVSVLLESGAAKYLEFKTCDAAIVTAELQQQQQQQQEEGVLPAAGSPDVSSVVGLSAYMAAETAETAAAAGRGPSSSVGGGLGGPRRPRRWSVAGGLGGSPPVGEQILLEATPMSKGQIFQSLQLSLSEKRQLMKFVAAAGAPTPRTTSTPFASPVQWRPSTPQGGPSGGPSSNRPQVQQTDAAASAAAPPSAAAATAADSGDCWDCYLEQQGLNAHLRRLVTYGVCLCDLPLLPPTSAAAGAGCCSGGGHRRRWRVSEGLERLRLFVSGCGLYGCHWAPLLYPLYGSGDIPQAFTRAAALSGAFCMLGASVETLQFVSPPSQQLQQQQHQHQHQQQQQGEGEEGQEEERLAALLQQSSSCLVLHCSNGERVASKLLLYESEALLTPQKQPTILKRQAKAFYRTIHSKQQQKKRQQQPPAADSSCTDASPSTAAAATATAAGAAAIEATETAAAADLSSVPTSFISSEEEGASSCCRLLAICTQPVLGGPGFRVGVVVARTACRDTSPPAAPATETTGLDSSSSNSSEAELPVHLLQTDASCAVAPKGYFLLHLSHVSSAAAPCCSDLQLQQQQQQQQVSAAATVSSPFAACGCCSSGAGRWRCGVALGGQETASSRSVCTASCGCGADAHCCPLLLRVLRCLLRSAGGLRSCYFLCSFRYSRHITAAAAAAAAAATPLHAVLPEPAADAQRQPATEAAAAAAEAAEPAAAATAAEPAEPAAAAAEAAEPAAAATAAEPTAAEPATAAQPATAAEPAAGEKETVDKGDPELFVLCGRDGEGSEALLSLDKDPCGVLSLPDACVSPCFPLLQECEAARQLVEGLLQQPLQPQQLVLKNARQQQEEGDELYRHLAEPYQQLEDVLEAAGALKTTPP